MLKKKAVIFYTAIIVLIGWISYAFGYVPPAEEIFSLMPHQKHCRINVMLLSLETTFYNEAWPDGRMSFTETVCLRSPDMFCSEIEVPSGTRIYVTQGEESLTAVDDKIISRQESDIDRYKDLFLYRSPESLVEALSRAGIDIAAVSFGRLEGKIAYVIGAVYPDESVPQVWVEKDTFRPLRMFFPAAEDSEEIDIRYEDYFNMGKGMWYPGRTTFYSDDRIIKEQKLKTYKTSSNDDAFPEYVFDIEEMERIYEFFVDPEQKGDASPGSDLDHVKKGIDDFQRSFE